ncbi:peptide chain release factor N(5)-glutamine methyltransferase [Ferrovibrio sp.]|uniref:peptide chain release factor N(5)-glutamine methyltransferase n=1 Tax=Ferrovibrio sp. TaxID=1917215 RepID=UPI002633AB3A|nr:peptide chain release factor N(5)-glutamine methyltransferase [Ferrovibrio sp.]
MPDIAGLLLDATRRLKQAGIEGPRQDAVLLLSEATGLTPDRVRLEPAIAVVPDIAARFEALLLRRLAYEPISHILGTREFWSLPFRVTRDVLDPRPDSETLVAGVLAAIPDRGAKLKLVDFGTGSGCLLLSLLHELPNASGLGVDASPAALKIAQENAERLGLAARARFRHGDWGAGIEERFDILISNPPYIESAVVPGLAPEVATYEPLLALDGGADGLAAYRRLVPDLARLAAPGAFVALEIGLGQDVAVSALLAGAGFAGIAVLPDLAGIGRVVTGRKSL